MSGFTQAQIADAKEIYELFDKNDDGKMSTEELGTMLRALGQNPTKKELDQLMENIDEDKSGYISFDEFVDGAAVILRENPEQDLIKAFLVFDEDGSGCIDTKEMEQMLKEKGDILTDEEVKYIMDKAEMEENGKIDVKKFVKLLMDEPKSAENSRPSSAAAKDNDGSG